MPSRAGRAAGERSRGIPRAANASMHGRGTVFGLVASGGPRGYGRGTVFRLVACERLHRGLPAMPRIQIPFLLASPRPSAMPRVGIRDPVVRARRSAHTTSPNTVPRPCAHPGSRRCPTSREASFPATGRMRPPRSKMWENALAPVPDGHVPRPHKEGCAPPHPAPTRVRPPPRGAVFELE